MKTILLLLLLAPGLRAAGQASPLPIDSLTHLVTYQGVVQVPGASQAELYSRAREWFAVHFVSSKSVLEMDDKAVGKLIGRGNSTLKIASILASVPGVLWRSIRIEIKDERFRYTIDRYVACIGDQSEAAGKHIEYYITPAWFTKNGAPRSIAGSMIEGVKQSGESESQSLRAAMTKPSSKSDW